MNLLFWCCLARQKRKPIFPYRLKSDTETDLSFYLCDGKYLMYLFPKKRNPFCPFRHGPVWPFTNAGLNIQRDPFGENNVVQLFPTHRIYEFGLGGLGFIIDTGWQMVWPGFGWQFVSLSYTATRIAENPPIKGNAPNKTRIYYLTGWCALLDPPGRVMGFAARYYSFTIPITVLHNI